jgi:hypothetical protein
MLYGDEKAREMGRSILPSKRRGMHKRQHRINRNHRRELRQGLREMCWHEDACLDYEGDLHSTPQIEIKYLVRTRRDGDKDKPVTRWAVANAAHLRKADRRAYIAAKLPDSLMGWHAMTHIEGQQSFDVSLRSLYTIEMHNEKRRALKLHYLFLYMQLADVLARVIDENRLKALNSVIYGNWQPSVYFTEEMLGVEGQPEWVKKRVYTKHINNVPPRTLKGKSDIASFIADVFADTSNYRLNRGGGSPCEQQRTLRYLSQVYGYKFPFS